MDYTELNNAKQQLKEIIINEKGLDYYYKLIADKTKWINDFKLVGDKVFGKNDDLFRKEVLNSLIDKGGDNSLFDLCIIDLALDVLID